MEPNFSDLRAEGAPLDSELACSSVPRGSSLLKSEAKLHKWFKSLYVIQTPCIPLLYLNTCILLFSVVQSCCWHCCIKTGPLPHPHFTVRTWVLSPQGPAIPSSTSSVRLKRLSRHKPHSSKLFLTSRVSLTYPCFYFAHSHLAVVTRAHISEFYFYYLHAAMKTYTF